MAAVTIHSDFGPQENEICHCFCLLWVMGRDAMLLVFWMLSFKPAFSLSAFTFIKKLLSSFSTWVQSQNDKMILVCFQGKRFNTAEIQVCAPTTDVEEIEVDQFYEDL